jgi:hypothetical protein
MKKMEIIIHENIKHKAGRILGHYYNICTFRIYNNILYIEYRDYETQPTEKLIEPINYPKPNYPFFTSDYAIRDKEIILTENIIVEVIEID